MKAQSVVQEVQVTPGLRSHAILDTSRLHCCLLTLSHPVSKEASLRGNIGLPRAFLVGDTKSVSGAPPGLLAGGVLSCQIAVLLRRSEFDSS